MASTMNVLQAQIEKLEEEATRIQGEVASVNTRLDEINLTIAQLNGFQAQLDRERPQHSGMRLAPQSDTASAVSNQVRNRSVIHSH